MFDFELFPTVVGCCRFVCMLTECEPFAVCDMNFLHSMQSKRELFFHIIQIDIKLFSNYFNRM